MSNMFPCTLEYENQTFSSSEHAYQWKRASDIGDTAIADEILKAPHGFAAKRLSGQLDKQKNTEWKMKNSIRVMTELVEAKYEQVLEFRYDCEKSWTAYLMEATFDNFWGVGLLETEAV